MVCAVGVATSVRPRSSPPPEQRAQSALGLAQVVGARDDFLARDSSPSSG